MDWAELTFIAGSGHTFPSPPHLNALPHTSLLTSPHTPTHFPAPLPTFSHTSFYLPPHPNTLPTPLLTLSPHTFLHSHLLPHPVLISQHTSSYLPPHFPFPNTQTHFPTHIFLVKNIFFHFTLKWRHFQVAPLTGLTAVECHAPPLFGPVIKC